MYKSRHIDPEELRQAILACDAIALVRERARIFAEAAARELGALPVTPGTQLLRRLAHFSATGSTSS
jgi:geranylgeranyl pyrophosphate synthase